MLRGIGWEEPGNKVKLRFFKKRVMKQSKPKEPPQHYRARKPKEGYMLICKAATSCFGLRVSQTLTDDSPGQPPLLMALAWCACAYALLFVCLLRAIDCVHAHAGTHRDG